MEDRLNRNVKQRIQDRINGKMREGIKNNRRRKNKTLITNHTTNYQQPINNYRTKIKRVEELTNSTDYEAFWDIAIDKWTRNWNFYREKLMDSIISKSNINQKRQKRQANLQSIELTGQHANGSATGPQGLFIELYDCEVDQIGNVKYYELYKISTCIFKPLDLEMTKTEVQLISKAKGVEFKGYAATGTIKERVEWCSQHTVYIRANRPSYYYSDARRTKILDAKKCEMNSPE